MEKAQTELPGKKGGAACKHSKQNLNATFSSDKTPNDPHTRRFHLNPLQCAAVGCIWRCARCAIKRRFCFVPCSARRRYRQWSCLPFRPNGVRRLPYKRRAWPFRWPQKSPSTFQSGWLDQNRICNAALNALFEQAGIRDKYIIADQLEAFAEPFGQQCPTIPIVFGHAVFNRYQRKLFGQRAQII